MIFLIRGDDGGVHGRTRGTVCITVAKTKRAVVVAVIFERRRPLFIFVVPAAADAADDDVGCSAADDDDSGGSGGGGCGCGSAQGRIMVTTNRRGEEMRAGAGRGS